MNNIAVIVTLEFQDSIQYGAAGGIVSVLSYAKSTYNAQIIISICHRKSRRKTM